MFALRRFSQLILGLAYFTFVSILQARAGQGGTFVLVNGTPYTWSLTKHHSYQMNDWSFPSSIAPGTLATVYVEWDQNIFDDQDDDGGEALYTLSGTGYSFQLQARAPNGVFDLRAYLVSISTAGNSQGSTIDLGWLHNQNNVFVLSGSSTLFSSSNPPPNWMQANLPLLGNRLIRELCIPGSHDAGISFLDDSGTLFSNELNTVTQTVPIYQQLLYGARYFDIRPVKSSGIYKAGHYGYTNAAIGWQGGNGQTVSSIISDINEFTSNNSELIFIKLSHDLDTDGSYDPLSQGQWNTLFSQLQTINYLYFSSATADFTKYTLNQFIQYGPAVVVLVSPSNKQISIKSFQGLGFYYENVSLPVYDNYSSTESLSGMMSDQLSKLATNRQTPDSPMFLLSWTLTMSPGDSISDGLSLPPYDPADPTIIGFAAQANNALSTGLLPSISKSVFPNIIYVDNFASSNITAVTMAVNAISANYNGAASSPYGQCGGTGWTGATVCTTGYLCTYLNTYYSQCLPY